MPAKMGNDYAEKKRLEGERRKSFTVRKKEDVVKMLRSHGVFL